MRKRSVKPNIVTVHKITDQYFSKPSRSPKTSKVPKTITAKRNLRRLASLKERGILDGILIQKKDIGKITKKI